MQAVPGSPRPSARDRPLRNAEADGSDGSIRT